MQFFFLAAILLAAAVVLWCVQAAGRSEAGPSSQEISGGEPARTEPDREVMEKLAAAVDALWTVMEHSELGGPGFITVRLSGQEEEGLLTVTAQYPNIRETLYRRVVRRELEPDALLAEGVPGKLLALSPCFETDSGGVVLLSVHISDGEQRQPAVGFRERKAVLEALAKGLRQREPELLVRCVGGELLLNRVREADAV